MNRIFFTLAALFFAALTVLVILADANYDHYETVKVGEIIIEQHVRHDCGIHLGCIAGWGSMLFSSVASLICVGLCSEE